MSRAITSNLLLIRLFFKLMSNILHVMTGWNGATAAAAERRQAFALAPDEQALDAPAAALPRHFEGN
jgi:hypothetical protein